MLRGAKTIARDISWRSRKLSVPGARRCRVLHLISSNWYDGCGRCPWDTPHCLTLFPLPTPRRGSYFAKIKQLLASSSLRSKSNSRNDRWQPAHKLTLPRDRSEGCDGGVGGGGSWNPTEQENNAFIVKVFYPQNKSLSSNKNIYTIFIVKKTKKLIWLLKFCGQANLDFNFN